MESLRYKLIGLDVDGTLIHDTFPNFTGYLPHAVRVLKKVVEHGGKIIVWTCRTGEHIDFAKNLFLESEIPYHAFNDNLEDNINQYGTNSRKIHADVYIDDKSIHCKESGIDWLEIEKLLFIKEGEEG